MKSTAHTTKSTYARALVSDCFISRILSSLTPLSKMARPSKKKIQPYKSKSANSLKKAAPAIVDTNMKKKVNIGTTYSASKRARLPEKKLC